VEYLLKSDVMAVFDNNSGFILDMRRDIDALPTFPDPSLAGWQDISSAPRDGTEILVAYARCGFVKKLVYFDKIHKYWKSKGEPELGLETNATHWMPLPSAPSEDGGKPVIYTKLSGLPKAAPKLDCQCVGITTYTCKYPDCMAGKATTPESGNSKLLEMIDTYAPIYGSDRETIENFTRLLAWLEPILREIARLLAKRGDK